MIEPVDTTEHMLFSTARIVADGNRGKRVGTAFFFDLFRLGKPLQKVVQLIVTNRHLVREADETTLLFHEAQDGKLTDASFPLTVGTQDVWISHPNEKTDLCAADFNLFAELAEKQGRTIFKSYLSNAVIWTDEHLKGLRAVERVLMVGYPNGLWDNVHNLPLIRAGITSTHPAIDYQGRAETMIDLACFEGSSGSPVMIHENGMISDKNRNVQQGERTIFLGVLSHGETIDAEAKLVASAEPEKRSIYQTELMLHLGVVIKAKEVLALAHHVARPLGRV